MIKAVLTIILIVLIVIVAYLGYDFYDTNFSSILNFNVNYTMLAETPSYNGSLQYFDNMRFSSVNINYKIGQECDLTRRSDMIAAFDYLENKTILRFSESSAAQIDVSCSEDEIEQPGNYLVGGRGGANYLISSGYNLIPNGSIILYDYDRCQLPLVPLHELLHVLGFNHSSSETSVMYPISSCSQALTNDIVKEIDRLYSIPSLPDLHFSDVSAFIRGSYVNLNFTVRNSGIVDAESVNVSWYAASERGIFELEEIEAGAGKIFYVTNLKTGKVDELNLSIVSSAELNFENNNASLLLVG